MPGRNVLILYSFITATACAIADGQAPTQQANALEMERRGRYEEAAIAYREALSEDASDVASWLGLERVFIRLGRLDSLIPLLDSAIASAPANSFVREVQLRAWSTLGEPDSVRAMAQRWIAAVPESPEPYRQWAMIVARSGDSEEGIEILRRARHRLGEAALASDMAQLLVVAGQWEAAAQEWNAAVFNNESFVGAAAAGLRSTPPSVRERVMRILAGPGSHASSQRLTAELLVAWDRPEEGWVMLSEALPADRAQAALALERFAERTSRYRNPRAARARGYALERLARISSGREAERAWLGAAQAFADAGNLRSARRMLERLTATSGDSPGDAAAAMATLIRVTVESGEMADAERRFRQWEIRMRADDARRLRYMISRGWIQRGKLDRAEAMLRGDSTVGTEAVRGWIALYRGDLLGATEHFRTAGPHAETRAQATRQTAMLALIQNIEPDSVPKLGQALLTLAGGDTAKAIRRLVDAAKGLRPTGGRAHVLAFAGDLAVLHRDYDRGERILLDALSADSSGSAAASAEYALAAAYSKTGRKDLSVQHLEHLILAYPSSAIVPEARRLLDQVRGLIPSP